MFSECSSLMRSRPADRRYADESGEEIGGLQKLLVALLSTVMAGGTAFAVAMPLALLHLR